MSAAATTVETVTTESIWTRAFWKGAAERAIKTFAQAFLAVFGVGTATEVTGGTLTAEMWYMAALSGVAAAALSVVMSIANPPFVAGKKVVEKTVEVVEAPAVDHAAKEAAAVGADVNYQPKHAA